MNYLLENNYIDEMKCGTNFSFILNDDRIFLATEYKVLQNQSEGCFVKCMKMLYNGKSQLYYLSQGMKSFSSLIPSLDTESFFTIVSNLLSDIVDVKNNGFLSCRNIDISFDKIFIDPATYKVSLVYLPLSKRLYEDELVFESELKAELVKLISCTPTLFSPKTTQLSIHLTNGNYSLEELLNVIKGDSSIPANKEKVEVEKAIEKEEKPTSLLRMIAMNSPVRFVIEVNKDNFTVGKKQDAVDGAVPFNKLISRIHCRINRSGDTYTVTDLDSANGTFVNMRRIAPNQPCRILNGDIVRLADTNFRINIIE